MAQVMPDIPVCAGRGDQPPCRWYSLRKPEKPRGEYVVGEDGSVKATGMADEPMCTAIFNVVTGEPRPTRCANARMRKEPCGRRGRLFQAAGEPAPDVGIAASATTLAVVRGPATVLVEGPDNPFGPYKYTILAGYTFELTRRRDGY